MYLRWFIVIFILIQQISAQFFDYMPLYTINQETFKNYDSANVKNISMVYSKVSTIDRNTFQKLYRLQELRLDHNEITTLHENLFDNNLRLEHLNFGWNRIHFLPPYIFYKLTNLQRLYFYKNNIKHLDLNIFSNQKSLKTLLIYANGLTALDANIFRATANLEYLHFGDNFIRMLHEDIFNNLPKLEVLMFHRNKIQELPKKIFTRLPTLRNLSIAQNEIRELDSELFDNNPNLEYLWLADNKISILKTGLFKNNMKLKFLDVKSNGLQKIEPIFAKNAQLQKLYIANNNLNSMDSNIITNLKHLQILFLDKNPWICNCIIKGIFTKWSVLKTGLTPICSEPIQIKSKTWTSLSEHDFTCPATFKIPKTKVYITGNSATIACETDSDIENLSWRFKDNSLVENKFAAINKPYKICFSKSQTGQNWYNLTIDNLDTTDSGLYKCSITDSYTQQDKEQYLHITPEILQENSKPILGISSDKDFEINADFGETITIRCQIFGQNNKVQWSFNGKPIDGSDQSFGGNFYKFKSLIVDTKFSWNNLTISGIRDEDSGIYSCKSIGYNIANQFVLNVSKKLNTYINEWTEF